MQGSLPGDLRNDFWMVAWRRLPEPPPAISSWLTALSLPPPACLLACHLLPACSNVVPSFKLEAEEPVDLRGMPPAVAEVYVLTGGWVRVNCGVCASAGGRSLCGKSCCAAKHAGCFQPKIPAAAAAAWDACS